MHRAPFRLAIPLLAIASIAVIVSTAATAATGNYVPPAMYCANGAANLCPVIPSFIVPDPMLDVGVGYQGLSNDVTSAANDVQSPFDNMAWQMFVALNWKASQSGGDPRSGLAGNAPVVWQTYTRPEDVFGGPAPSCPNPGNLPRFSLIAKSDGQDSSNDEFLQATGQPLIDVNGNWTLFERRMNDVEKKYIFGNRLDSLAGQQAFVLSGKTVAFPIGDMTTTAGQVGAIEVKASWRIVSDAEKSGYFAIQALLDVEGGYVSDGKPLCATVTLGLTGLHIIQNNGEKGDLKPDFIWATFEHQKNVPLATAACDPVDTLCYKNIQSSKVSPNICPANGVTGSYSFFNAACTNVVSNAPPVKKSGQTDFIWNRQPPYAGQYTTQQGSVLCGTQATRCWKVYKLTDQLNAQWRAKLGAIQSVFANYQLIGTNWGGNVEPTPGTLANGAVPAFLGNSSLETYIQASPTVGNCTGCHSNATLAYEQQTSDPKKPKTFPADFSFLLGLAQKTCADVDAGPIWNNQQAGQVCPGVCSKVALQWNGQWTTTQQGVMSVCGCCLPPQ
jgi:hypothetical protein